MPSERLQRQIDRLLDQVESSAGEESWDRVRELCHRVLAIDPENGDAKGFLAMAADSVVGDASAAIEELAASAQAPEVPSSFVGGRYKVARFLGEGGKKRVDLAHDELLDRDVAATRARSAHPNNLIDQ